MTLETITKELYWVLIAILVLNLFQRKHQPRSNKKRQATLLIAVLVLILNLVFALIINFGLPVWTAAAGLLIPILVGYLLRSKIGIFKRKCVSCGTKLTWNETLYYDDNLCPKCHGEHFPEQYEDNTEVEIVQIKPADAKKVEEIDWETWEPEETAVICYLFDGDNVLLINKKTGLGKGYVNAAGGRIEEDETALEAAVREMEEETGITPINPEPIGVLNFQFTDGYSLKGYVFFAFEHSGIMKETEEADPFWVKTADMPYDKMWEDDRHWLPDALEGKKIEGHFIFNDREMLSMDIRKYDE